MDNLKTDLVKDLSFRLREYDAALQVKVALSLLKTTFINFLKSKT